MLQFVMLTRLAAPALGQPRSFQALEREVSDAVQQHCPRVQWKGSYALLGPWDYLDLLHAPDLQTTARVSLLVRSLAQAHTEIWPALAWGEFKGLISERPGGA